MSYFPTATWRAENHGNEGKQGLPEGHPHLRMVRIYQDLVQ